MQDYCNVAFLFWTDNSNFHPFLIEIKMKKIQISLVSVGTIKYPVNFGYLEHWSSRIIMIRHGASIGQIPNAEGSDWEYPNEQLAKIIKRDATADITVALINVKLEANYYMRRLGDNVAVLSLYEMADIIRFSDFTVENYILRNLYELVVLYTANNQVLPTSAYTWAHDEVRGCLFDMNASKPDIIFSMHRPILCHACRNRVLGSQVDVGFLPALYKELSRIRKALFFRIIDWIKRHPLWVLVITALSGILVNLISSIIFGKIMKVCPWIG